MFELFIALFGGLFLGSKLINDKIETKNARTMYEQNAKTDAQRKQIWLNKVTDKKLEEEIELLVYYPENHDKIRTEVLETYKEMPWKKDKTFICLTPEDVITYYGKGVYTKKEREIIAEHERKEILRILMANRGKLLYLDAEYGISQNNFFVYPAAIARQKSIDEVDFILWLTKKAGINERVFIKQSTHYYLASKYPTYLGDYQWESLIPTFLQHNKHC
jgi:hypothetical protein